MKRRPKRSPNHERWLVSYADFITLLFAFFVVLYASAQVDNKKIVQMSAAIKGGFQELGVFSGTGDGTGPGSAEAKAEVHQPSSVSSAEGEGGAGRDVGLLRRELEQALGEEIKKHEIQMRLTPEGLVVSLSEVGFFDSGEAKLLPEGEPTLTRIATVLNRHGFQIRVEGHTDNVPIHTANFKSNWELSTARATEVVSILVERYHLDPRLISAAGYSEYRPITANDSDEGRKTNRRVDLVVVSRVYRASSERPPAASPVTTAPPPPVSPGH